MNPEQVKSFVRWFISSPIGVAIISHGWASGSTLEIAGGILSMLIPMIWSQFVHTQANAVAVVDTLAQNKDSPVKAVIMEPTVAGRDLANSLPGSTTVVAGTTLAVEAAKAA